MSVESIAHVLRHSTASGNDRLVLIGIANHDGDGGSWPTIATLAMYANVSTRTVRRCLRNLEAIGEVVVHANDGGTHKTRADQRPNRYTITVEEREDTGVTPSDVRGDTADPTGGHSGPDGGTLLSSEPSLTIQEPLSPAVTGGDAFEVFWAAYPRRTGKKDARTAFAGVLRRGVDVRDIQAGVVRFAADPNLPPETFIPHPATWLRQERWADPPLPKRETPGVTPAAYTPEESAARKAPIVNPPPALDDDPTGGARWLKEYRSAYAITGDLRLAVQAAHAHLHLDADGRRREAG